MDCPWHILVANEPRTYRDMLATELPQLRPALHVRATDPGELDPVLADLRPLLVICSQLTSAIAAHATVVIVLYPDGQDQAVVAVAGKRWVLSGPRLADLLAAIDAIVRDLTLRQHPLRRDICPG